MTFDELINNVNDKDRENYQKYSPIRGVQQYKIVFSALSELHDEIEYSDVNAFVIYDKAIKDVLYTFLGTLEDLIKSYIFKNFDLNPNVTLKTEYLYFKDLKGNIVSIDNINDNVTELYSRWHLTFGGLIEFLDYYDNNKYDIESLKKVKELRNSVMHHSTLLFDSKGNSKAREIEKQIDCLIKLLPCNYTGLIIGINDKTEMTRKNINPIFENLLLKKF